MPECNFNKVALQHIFRTPLLSNTSGWLLLTTENSFGFEDLDFLLDD